MEALSLVSGFCIIKGLPGRSELQKSMITRFTRVFLGIAVCAGVLVQATAARAQTPVTALVFDSDPGDWIGQGQERTWFENELTFRAFAGSTSRAAIRADNFSTGGSTWWDITLAAPGDASLVPGTYENATNAFSASLLPYLSVSGSGRGCTGVGRFTIYEVAFDSSGKVTRLAADFEQHCNDGVPALFGAIRFNAVRSSLIPFDGNYPVYSLHVDPSPYGNVAAAGIDCGDGGVDCDETYASPATVTLTVTPAAGYTFIAWAGDCTGGLTATTTQVARRRRCTPYFDATPGSGSAPPPRTGSLLFLDSQPGEPIGDGQRWFVRSNESRFSVFSATASRVSLSINAGTGDRYSLAFSAPQGMTLAGSAFDGATRDSFKSPLKPGLDISGRGTGCNTLRGRFVVYELVLSANGELQRFAADFEQHCEDGLPGLFGAIRFNSTYSALIPFGGLYPVYTLRITPPLNGRVTSAGIQCGISGGSDCQETYATGGNVSLTAVPDPGYVFLGWMGDCSGAATSTIFVNSSRTCGALFDNAAGGTGPVADDLKLGALFFDSQPGDFIGQGQRRVWTRADTLFTPNVGTSTQSSVSFTVATPDGDTWSLTFGAPAGESLRPGDYIRAGRYEQPPLPVPGFSISGHGRGCNRVQGRFRIYELHFDASNRVDVFAADFEQHCEGVGPALFGAIRYNATRAALLPFDGVYPVFGLRITPPMNGRITAPGIDCTGTPGADCEQAYVTSGNVTVTAQPDPGYVFLGWTGDCSGGATGTVFVNSVRGCGAVFDNVAGGDGPVADDLKLGSLFLDSEAGDFPGGGKRRVWTRADSVFQPTTRDSGRTVSFTVRTPDGVSSSLDFSAPAGELLHVGDYERATRYPFQSPMRPGLSVSSLGSGCNRSIGRFRIYEIHFDSAGKVDQFAADFEQHCDSVLPGLFGSIRYNSTRAALLPFDGAYPVYSLRVTPPVNGRILATGIHCTSSGFADCHETFGAGGSLAITATPDSGFAFVGWTGDCEGAATSTLRMITQHACGAIFENASPRSGTLADDLRLGSLFFYSQKGDYVGQGQRQVWTRADTAFKVAPRFSAASTRTANFTVTTPDGDSWTLDFSAPAGEALHAGDYTGATRYPFQAANVPGFDISGHGRGCNQETGRFRIYEIHFDATGQVDALAADFEQHCEGFAAALFGAIRYNSTRTTLMPFDGAFLARTNISLDAPVAGVTVTRPFWITGWALNRAATSGPGVSAVHVYAFPATGGTPVLLGAATYGVSRSDVGALFGAQFTASGFSLNAGAETLAPGRYFIAAYAQSTVTGAFDAVQSVEITIPKPVSTPVAAIDLPTASATTAGAFQVAGWAVDLGSVSGTGITTVHVYAFRSDGSAPIFLGVAAYGDDRPDVGAVFGARFNRSGYHLTANNLPPGDYTIVVYPRSTVSGEFSAAAARTITRVSKAMSIDTPVDVASLNGTFVVAGWAFDAAAASGPGVDAVHVWAFPSTGGAPQFVGVAEYGAARPDVGASFGARFTASGYNVVASLPPGTWQLAVYAHSAASGTFDQVRTITVTVQ
jgi:hypothetical protein